MSKQEAIVNFRLSKELNDEFKKAIEIQQATASKVIRRLIADYVKSNAKKAKSTAKAEDSAEVL